MCVFPLNGDWERGFWNSYCLTETHPSPTPLGSESRHPGKLGESLDVCVYVGVKEGRALGPRRDIPLREGRWVPELRSGVKVSEAWKGQVSMSLLGGLGLGGIVDSQTRLLLVVGG